MGVAAFMCCHSCFVYGHITQFWKPKERKAIPMRENVNRVERDAEGNYWFLSDLLAIILNGRLIMT